MASVVNLAEEVLDGVLQAAEHLQSSVVAAEAGAVEALRWAGALPLLLRDLGVAKLVSTESLWACQSKEHVAALLQPQLWGEHRRGDTQPEAEADDAAFVEPIEHLVVLVTGFLWDYEAKLIQLLQFGVVQRLTVCSSLSERAHECYGFEGSSSTAVASSLSRGVKKMDFNEFASAISAHNAFQEVLTKRSRHPKPQLHAPLATQSSWSEKEFANAENDGENEGGDDEWGWNEESSWAEPQEQANPSTPATNPGSATPIEQSLPIARTGVGVIQLPLNFAPLLSSKGNALEPSVFVLCHPICATAFPLLLSHVVTSSGALVSSGASRSSSATAGPSSLHSSPLLTYSHVKDVAPEHIPSEFRRSLKLLAHTLGEMLVNMRLDFKERIFTMGATSLKIGHTLVRDCVTNIVGRIEEACS